MSNSGSFTMAFDADGYSQSLRWEDDTSVAMQVTGDESFTWKLQGSLDKQHWFDLEDGDSAVTVYVDTDPREFDVSAYRHGRVWVDDGYASDYLLSFKGTS